MLEMDSDVGRHGLLLGEQVRERSVIEDVLRDGLWLRDWQYRCQDWHDGLERGQDKGVCGTHDESTSTPTCRDVDVEMPP